MIFISFSTYSLRVLGLPQYLEEVVVREEVESGEELSLGLQVHVQGPLDAL